MGGRCDEGLSEREARSAQRPEEQSLPQPSRTRRRANHGFAERRNLGAPSRPPTHLSGFSPADTGRRPAQPLRQRDRRAEGAPHRLKSRSDFSRAESREARFGRARGCCPRVHQYIPVQTRSEFWKPETRCVSDSRFRHAASFGSYPKTHCVSETERTAGALAASPRG